VPLSPLLQAYDQVILDLDGCVWIGDQATPGAPEAVAALRHAGKAVAFATNNSWHPGEEHVRRLWSLGIQASLTDVVTVGGAVQHLLAETRPGRSAFVIGRPSLVDHVADAGLKVVNGTEHAVRAEVVLVGSTDAFDYDSLRTAVLAVRAGADLLATDYAPESLLLTRITALRHCGLEPRTMQLNWRQPSQDLLAGYPAGYPVVLAADVLYERRDILPLLDLFDRIVEPDGVLWLAEPGRPPASIFLETASRQGWSFASATWTGPWPDPGDAEVVARVHQLRRR